MKRNISAVLSAWLGCLSLLIAVTGCTFENGSSDSLIKFSAASSLETKVYYGDEVNGYMQMVWENGDQIRIVSDRAQTSNHEYSHDYTLRHDREEGSHSFAKFVMEEGETGLRWEESGYYDFFASYPPVSLATDGSITATLPDDAYLMVAHTKTTYSEQRKVFLSFYPAFTAVNITILTDAAGVTIDNCELYSSSTALSGTFRAKIGDSGLTSYSVQSGMYYAAPTLTSNVYGGKEFTFFCLPHDLRNMSLSCYYTKNGSQQVKSIDLVESGGSMVFSSGKYHRLSLTIDSSGGGEIIDFSSLTMGGSQMLLSLLKENAWSLQQYAQSQNVYLDQNLAVNLFNYYVNNNVGQVDARDAFKGTGSNSYSAAQLPVVKKFLETLTSYTHQNTLWATIEATDFQFVPNLEVINQLEVDPQRINDYSLSIDVSGLQKLKTISLYKCTHIKVRNCPELTSVSTLNVDNNVDCEFELDNCPKVTSFTQDWNGQRGSFTFKNMSGLQVISLKNGASISISDCGALTSLSMEQASNLSSLSLSDVPNFQTGTFNTVEKTVSVYLNNCSANVSGAAINMRGNGNASNDGKTNSDNLTVTFTDNGGSQKVQF